MSARGLRLYYDAVKVASNLGLQLASGPLETFFLDSNGGPCGDVPSPTATTFPLVDTAPGAGAAKCRDSSAINFAGGNPWRPIGTWSLPLH